MLNVLLRIYYHNKPLMYFSSLNTSLKMAETCRRFTTRCISHQITVQSLCIYTCVYIYIHTIYGDASYCTEDG